MNKRYFLKTGLLGAFGLMSLSSFSRMKGGNFKSQKTFGLPDLPYAYDALEPFIDKETMFLHHTKHHATYTNRLNVAIKDQSISVENLRTLLENDSKYHPEVITNATGYLNHRMFFKMLTPNGGGPATGKIADAINSEFGSFENFKKEFSSTANNHVDSGWTWLINQNGTLKVVSTMNHENPFMDTLSSGKRGFPLLCIDLWEHAYFLKYQKKKEEYIDAFWNIVNWKTVNNRYNKSIS